MDAGELETKGLVYIFPMRKDTYVRHAASRRGPERTMIEE